MNSAWRKRRRQLSRFMRPALLNPLFAPLRALPGVGPKTGKLFDKLLAHGPEEARVLDALFHLPHSTIDRRSRPKIADAGRDLIVTLEVTVAEHRPPPGRNGRGPYRILVQDETGDVHGLWLSSIKAMIAMTEGEEQQLQHHLKIYFVHVIKKI